MAALLLCAHPLPLLCCSTTGAPLCTLLLDAPLLCGYIFEWHVVLAEKGRGHIAPVTNVTFPLIEYQV
jgi:hypothetical protein